MFRWAVFLKHAVYGKEGRIQESVQPGAEAVQASYPATSAESPGEPVVLWLVSFCG